MADTNGFGPEGDSKEPALGLISALDLERLSVPSSDTGKPKMSPEREQKGFSVVHRRQIGMCYLLLPLCLGAAPGGDGLLERTIGWCELMATLGATEGRGAASQGIPEPREFLVGSTSVGEGLSALWDTFTCSQPQNPNAGG